MAKLPRFESIATISSSQCDSEFFVGGSGDAGGGGGGGLGQYGDYFGQPHTIANGYATGSRAKFMSL